MKFTCYQSDLSKALSIVSKAISNRTTIPILKGILLEVDKEGILKLSASDMDLSIEKKIAVNVINEGSIVLSAKLLVDIIRKLPNDQIEIEEKDGNVSIKCVNTEFNIVGQSPDDFPKIGNKVDIDPIRLDKEIVKEMIKKTSFAASIEEAKGVIVGVLLEINEGILSMVALDGFRMAVTREKVDDIDNVKLIISARILNEINKIFIEEEDCRSVNIVLDKQRAIFFLDDVCIVLRIMEGEFIKYKDILPKEYKTRLKINRIDMISCLERASLLAREGRNNLIRLLIENEIITINSQSEGGNVKEEVYVDKEGEDLEIGFNVKYLMEVFKVITDEELVMEFSTNISPCLIKPLEGDSFEYLILPVRISTRSF